MIKPLSNVILNKRSIDIMGSRCKVFAKHTQETMFLDTLNNKFSKLSL